MTTDLAPPPPAPVSPVAAAPSGATPASSPGMNLGQGGDPSILAMALQKGAEQASRRPPGRPPGSKNVAQPLNQGQHRQQPAPAAPPPAAAEPPPEAPTAPTVTSNLLKDLERLHGSPAPKLQPLPPPEPEAPAGTPTAVAEVTPENYTVEQAERDAEEIIRNPHVKAKTRAVIEKFRTAAKDAEARLAAAPKAPAEITEDNLPEPIKNRLKERDMLMFERNADALPEVQRFKQDITSQDDAIVGILSKYFNPATLTVIKESGGFEKFIQANPDSYRQIKDGDGSGFNGIPQHEFDRIQLHRGEAMRSAQAMDRFIQEGKSRASEILKQQEGSGKAGNENILRSLRQWQTKAFDEVPILKVPVLPANATREQQEVHSKDVETNKTLRGLVDSHVADISSGDPKRIGDATARLIMYSMNGVSAMVLAQTWEERARFFEAQYNRMKGTQLGNPGGETPRVPPVEEPKPAVIKAGMTPKEGLEAMASRLAQAGN